MKVKKQLLTLCLVGMACLFFAAAIQAATEVADVIPLQDPAYEKHTKGIVQFTHKKHATEYGGACGDCHHDDKGQPLADQAALDAFGKVRCIECHKIASTVPKEIKKEWKEKKVSKEEQKKLKLEYHAEAVHMNCIACHKKWNKENKSKAAPVSCSKCHPKKAK
ncbi:MAG: cytochrome c3 family protein [Desulfobacterales bacterium]|nr:cytochrome c3 family protein [Desulfobacterales bacterium]